MVLCIIMLSKVLHLKMVLKYLLRLVFNLCVLVTFIFRMFIICLFTFLFFFCAIYFILCCPFASLSIRLIISFIINVVLLVVWHLSNHSKLQIPFLSNIQAGMGTVSYIAWKQEILVLGDIDGNVNFWDLKGKVSR